MLPPIRKCLVPAVPIPAILIVATASAGAQPGMTNARYLVLFHQRCATCHGVGSAVPRAASLEALRALSPERVYEALTAGSMAVNAAELGDEEKRGLATYVAGRPFGNAVDRSAAAMSNPCPSDVTPDARLAAAQWNGKNADPTTGARFQSAEDAGLTADDVRRLALQWSFGLPGSGGMRAQPVVVGGRLYLGSDNGFVYALDARSGCVHWSFDVGTPVVSAVSVGTVPGTERDAVYFGDWRAHVHAVDAGSGQPLWRVRVDDHPMAKITGSPVLEPGGERLYVPVGSLEEAAGLTNAQHECCTSQGAVVVLDAADGTQIWKSYTIPERPRPVRENWLGVQQYGPAGAGVWSAPVLDLRRRAVYVGTGNGYINVPDGGSSDAVIAFDLDTGRRLWSTQLLAGDQNCGLFDMTEEVASLDCPGHASGPNDDVSGSPILVTLPSGRDVLIAGQESSRVTALDPDAAAPSSGCPRRWTPRSFPRARAWARRATEPSTTAPLRSRTGPAAWMRCGRTPASACGTRPTPYRRTARTPRPLPAPPAYSGPRPSFPAWCSPEARAGCCVRTPPGTARCCGSTTRCATSRPTTAWLPAEARSADTDRRSSEACCSSVRATRYSTRPATCSSRSASSEPRGGGRRTRAIRRVT